ncbi:3168_t:CDS:2 [Cetraspora pellucida]|uniref:3168_t:CDS:1 n=1 Tax=Cetraspora pellucida TaxID=1433469 RepID=A0A9N9JVZ7_9GLOM|nr:3168_t:CDS:2 [Cetraspora pellucida]
MSDLYECYFNITDTFELLTEEFEKQWAFVNNFWTRFNGYKQKNGDEWKIYVCRLLKPKTSSGRKEDISPEKLHITWKQPLIECNAKIKITWIAATKIVHVERINSTLNHSHTIDEVDARKHSKFIKKLVHNEAVKDYHPPAIANVVRNEAKKVYENSGVEYLKTQEVANVKFKLMGSMNSHLIGESRVKADVIKTKSYSGFCFANSEKLKNLMHYSWLTLIDSIHNTNKHDWRMFILYVCDGCGCWNISAHFFVSNENSKVVMLALKIIRKFAPHWNPRYMLLDQSSVEANGIEATFLGSQAGEQECTMHKRTQTGCEDVIRDAIANCPVPAVIRYITRNYLKNTNKWVLWA